MYAFQRTATHLPEIAHGLAALNCHVMKHVKRLEDAALIGWDMDSVAPGMRLQRELALMTTLTKDKIRRGSKVRLSREGTTIGITVRSAKPTTQSWKCHGNL